MKKIILSSSSPARKELLQRLLLPFEVAHPHIDETPLKKEKYEDFVQRLALEKAQAVSQQFQEALIIGSDTIGLLNDQILCKPLSYAKAIEQLLSVSNQSVTFLTGLCLLDNSNQEYQLSVERYIVKFRELSKPQIQRYLDQAGETVLHCAGSFQAEKSGIKLVEYFSGNDFTSLIGLPLIRLTSMLKIHHIF